MDIGNKIKMIRMEKKMSQSEFADLLGINRTTLSKWENNVNLPGINEIENICRISGITMNQFLHEGTIAQNKEQKRNLNMTVNYISVIVMLFLSYVLFPFGIIISIFSVIFSFKKGLHFIVRIISIVLFIFLLDAILMPFGIYLMPPITRIF